MWSGKRLPLIVAIVSLSLFFAPSPMAGQIQLQLISQNPPQPEANSPLVVVFRAQYSSGVAQPAYAQVVWCGPGQQQNQCPSTSWISTAIPASTPQTDTMTWTPTQPGIHKLYVRMGNQGLGWGWSNSLEFTVSAESASLQETAQFLDVTVTHSPPEPVAHQPSRGNDHRDPITLGLRLENTSPDLVMKPLEISFPTADWYYHGPWAIPELAPGDTAWIRVSPTTLNEPGEKEIDVILTRYDGAALPGSGILLTSYTFTAVPLVQRTFAAGVDPNSGPHGSTFNFYATYTSADNLPPQSVTLHLDGETFSMTRDPSFTQEMVYTFQKTLEYGSHEYAVEAQLGGSEVLFSGTRSDLTVTDPFPPAVVGPAGADTVLTHLPGITLEGTATDVGSGVKEIQFRLSNRGGWKPVPGGADGWTLAIDTVSREQQRVEVGLDIRAVDQEGNVTPDGQLYHRALIFDRRHPRVNSWHSTEALFNYTSMQGLYPSPPTDMGAPTMGNTYFIALEIENPSAETQEITLGWKEEGYDQVDSEWQLNMDRAGGYETDTLTLGPGVTSWLYMPFEHSWDWIPDKGFWDFLGDLITAFIPVSGQVANGEQFAVWGKTMDHFVPEVTWNSVPHSVSSNLSPVVPGVTVNIEVSLPKKGALWASFLSATTGSLATVIGVPMLTVPVVSTVGAVLCAAEALAIVASHVLYQAAYDPSPDYRQAVQVQEVRIREFEELDPEDPLRRGAEATLGMAVNARAYSEAYIRYLGAVEAGDSRSAVARAQEAATFAQEASRHAEGMATLTEVMVQRVDKADRSELDAMRSAAGRGGLPEIEIRILKDFGLSQKDIEEWSKPRPDVLGSLLENPGVVTPMPKQLAETFVGLAKLMEGAAQTVGRR